MQQKGILLLLFLFISINLLSQTKTIQYGVKAGLNSSNFLPNKQLKEYYTFNSRIGFHVGAFAQYPLSTKFSIKPGLLLTTLFSEADIDETQLNIETPFDPDPNKDYRFNIKEYLISVPILINFKIDDHYDIETGFPVSYAVSSKAPPNEAFAISYYNEEKFQLEWQLGVGYIIANKYRIALNINAGITERNNTRSQMGQIGMEYFF